MVKRRILVVDDEQGMLEVCQETLEALEDATVDTCSNSPEAVERIKSEGVDLLVADIRMPGLSGVELLEQVRELDPHLPVLLMTAYPTVKTAVQAMRLGAADYLSKPFHPDQLLETARRLLDELRVRSEHRLLARHVGRDFVFGEMIGGGLAMKKTFDLIDRVAPTQASVLITGETGTGKELVARSIHQRSPRSSGRFVPVDSSTIPENLMESEFFGHERGAFTGASQREIGLMEYADGGTLFLDEVAELPLRLQAKLLRGLQENAIRRVGGRREISVDVRVIAATNREIQEEVEAGTFREDLYYRLNVVRIDVPPLRERREDIALLGSHFLRRYAEEIGRPVREVDEEALEILTHYDWPGNVREMQNVFKRAVTLASGNVIGIDDLPESIVLNARSRSESDGGGFFERRASCIEKFERDYFRELLADSGGNVSRAAGRAGLPRGTLYRLLRGCKIDPKDYRT